MDDPSELIPAPLVRQELGLTQRRFDDLVSSGRLVATRTDNQRWFATRAAVERFREEEAA